MLLPLFLMADAVDMIELLQSLNVEQVASQAVQDSTDQIADLNATQLAQGLRSDGSEILPSYAELTIELKKGKPGLSGVTDHVTLYDEGSHYRGLYAEVQGEDIEFGSHDPKSEKLQKKYDTKKGSIYGLTADSREDLITGKVGDAWQRNIEEQTGLKFS